VLDIVDVIYDVPATVRLESYRPGLTRERAAEAATHEGARKQDLEEALANYRRALEGLDHRPLARRHVQFKIGRLLALLAEGDPTQVGAAIKALADFKREHAASWQITACAKLLAQLQLARGDSDAALKTYQELATVPALPREISRECALLSARALLRGKQLAEAEKQLRALLQSVPSEDPLVIRARICQAECRAAAGQFAEAVRQLEGIITATADHDAKALAYNTLGDCYQLENRPRDALWAYLWVDVLYHHDHQEHARAITQLAKLFEALGDSARATQYRQRLKADGK
jgi:lipopolysaccharide biosynthesis regulator YciM